MRPPERINPKEHSKISKWNMALSLPELSAEELRLSRGFLNANLSGFFSSFIADWQALMLNFGLDISLLRTKQVLQIPKDANLGSEIEINGEKGVLAFREAEAHKLIEQLFSESQIASDSLLKYLEHRLLYSLSKSWQLEEELSLSHLGDFENLDFVTAAVAVEFSLAGESLTVFFGLNSETVKQIDSLWKKKRFEQEREKLLLLTKENKETFEISIDLLEFNLNTDALSTYLSTNEIVDLGVPLSTQALINLDGRPWAQGLLYQYDGRLAVKVIELKPTPTEIFLPSLTKVRLQIAKEEFDLKVVSELLQKGAIFVMNKLLDSTAEIQVEGYDYTGTALIGQYLDNYAIKVLSANS